MVMKEVIAAPALMSTQSCLVVEGERQDLKINYIIEERAVLIIINFAVYFYHGIDIGEFRINTMWGFIWYM